MDVSRTVTIARLIEAYPHVVPVLQEAGVHCVGCGVSEIETIEEGLRHHGRSDPEIDEIVERLVHAAQNPDMVPNADPRGIEISTAAALTFGDVIRQREKLGCALRISVIDGSYRFEIDDTKRHDDQVLTIAGTRFYIDSDSRGSLKGAVIDYSKDAGTFSITKP